MDALKKAEQEKREAARRLEETTGAVDAPASPSADVPPGDITSETAVEAVPLPAPAIGDTTRRSTTLELELEPLAQQPVQPAPSEPVPPRSPAVEIQPPPVSARPAATETGKKPAPALDTGDQTVVDQRLQQAKLDGDQTFHGVGLEQAIPGLYEATIQGEAADLVEAGKDYEETLPGVPAIQLARDIGGDGQPTPVAAATVFAAGSTRSQTSAGLKWTLISLTVLAVLAAGVWYYYTVTPVSRNVPSPFVARGIETLAPANVPLETTVPPAAAPVVGEVPPAGATEAPVDAAPDAEAPPAEAPPTVAAADVPATASPAVAAADVPAAAAPIETAPASPAPAPAEMPAASAAPAASTPAVIMNTPPPSLVKISRRKAPREDAVIVRNGYAAYQSGDLMGAKAHYAAVLEDFPDNEDALLGLGAIALRENNATMALQFYSKVLRLDPRNEVARAALIGMQRDADLVRSESVLKVMIQEAPEHAFLHFTLGNIYAAQQRWAEAQQAFFDAYNNDSSNPDFAFNLAVSLDRMGQGRSALDYYQTALRLADGHSSSFDTAAVLSRVQTLSRVEPAAP